MVGDCPASLLFGGGFPPRGFLPGGFPPGGGPGLPPPPLGGPNPLACAGLLWVFLPMEGIVVVWVVVVVAMKILENMLPGWRFQGVGIASAIF